ncbi:MAG: hypothetical protein AAGA93_10650 [Actinomycetota bacterium]
MAKQRSSFAKLQRDKAKKERAARKRANRQERRSGLDTAPDETEVNDDAVSLVSGDGEPSPQELLQLVEDLHKRREAGLISEDDFEEAKVELFARLQID